VPFEDGADLVTPVIARAITELGELRRTGPDPAASEAPAEVEHLADIAEVLAGERRSARRSSSPGSPNFNPNYEEGPRRRGTASRGWCPCSECESPPANCSKQPELHSADTSYSST